MPPYLELTSPAHSARPSANPRDRLSYSLRAHVVDLETLERTLSDAAATAADLTDKFVSEQNRLVRLINTCLQSRHVPRRSLKNRECSFYLRSLDGVALTALTWCKNGCGQNVDRECMERWVVECVDSGREVTCVDCRAVWLPLCEHDEKMPEER
ncbi:hypothetical protein LTS18_010840 [Coniosporium uncinatum]|uniref:Uncharacterized protein n=1 Tax=Coniosporium uncinatum TaxID=93489 RepID=A0ACC3D9Z2_9PEZI|nr:hypothetical protein LTS18_010840 [Coniosporium uncinatum]